MPRPRLPRPPLLPPSSKFHAHRAARRSTTTAHVAVVAFLKQPTRDTPPMTQAPNAATPPQPGVRIDVWLWAARFFKTRSLAKHAIETGKVEVDGQRAKASRQVHVGDSLVVVRGEERFEFVVRGLSDTRGSAPVAQALYEESIESRERRDAERAMRAAERAGYRAPDTKPDKRARRLIRALGDIDAL